MSSPPTGSHYDVVIVGGRVAGAATALLLARQGRRVLLLERGRLGSDTLSTHVIMRAGVMQLHRWGLLDQIRAAGTPPLKRTTFSYAGDETVIDVKPADGVDALYAPRRTILDPILVQAAIDAGVTARFETTVKRVNRSRDGRVSGITLRDRSGLHDVASGLVIGADGVASGVADAVEASYTQRGTAAGLAVYAYFTGLETDGNEWHYSPGAAAGLIPTNGGEVCVFAAADAVRFQGLDAASLHQQLLDEVSAALARRLQGARRVSRFHRFSGRPGHIRRSHGPGWALVGDAGYFKDPITAHGITDALRDAELLARAIDAGDLAGYERQRDDLSRDVFTLTEAIASYRWDLEEVQNLLFDLSRAMRAEVAAVQQFDRHPLPIQLPA